MRRFVKISYLVVRFVISMFVISVSGVSPGVRTCTVP